MDAAMEELSVARECIQSLTEDRDSYRTMTQTLLTDLHSERQLNARLRYRLGRIHGRG
jgi:hypothetical protein